MHKYLSERCKKDRARFVSVVPSLRTRGDAHTEPLALGHPARAGERSPEQHSLKFQCFCCVFENTSPFFFFNRKINHKDNVLLLKAK